MLLSINAYINAEINTMIDDISGIYASNTMLNELQISLTQVHRYLETFLDTRDTEAIEGYLRNQQEFSNRLERLNGRLLDDDSMITQKNIGNLIPVFCKVILTFKGFALYQAYRLLRRPGSQLVHRLGA